MDARCVAALALWLGGCGAPPPPPEAPDGWTEQERRTLAAMRVPDHLPADPSNRFADEPLAASLGRALFYDTGLSPSGRFACVTCHDPAHHFSDPKPRSTAAGVTARHTPIIEGSQIGPWFFWDGRVDSLWAQAAGPIESPDEMASDRLFVVRYVAERYGAEASVALGPMPTVADLAGLPAHARPGADLADPAQAAWAAMSEADQARVTDAFVRVVKAIAAFERLLIPGVSRFDRYLDAIAAGDATGGQQLSEPELRGLQYFLRDGNCASCHHGPMLSDRAFHNLGLPLEGAFDNGRTTGASAVKASELRCGSRWSDQPDCAELRYLNPDFPDFIMAFKTPSLRNVTLTAPYMHNGSFASLDAVLDFYSELPGEPFAGHRELTLQPLHITPGQRGDLVAFLNALEAAPRPEAWPR